MPGLMDVLLRQPEIAALVFGFQFGVYQNVLSRFRVFNCHVDALLYMGQYYLDASMASESSPLRASTLCLADHGTRDARFPLHFAIYKGDVQAALRIVRCRPDLVTQDAVRAAFYTNQLEIAARLLELSAKMPELHRSYGRDRRSWPVAPIDTRLLERVSVDALALLWRHRSRDWPLDFFKAAARSSSNAVVAFLYGVMPDAAYEGILDDVASRGLVAIVRDLHEKGAHCTTAAMDLAATGGYLDVVQFLYDHRTEGCTGLALDGAITYGHLDVVQFLIEECRLAPRLNAIDLAAATGQARIVEYLDRSRVTGCTTMALDDAAISGQLDIVRYLLAHRTEGGTRETVVRVALEQGHVEIARILLSAGYPFPTPPLRLWKALRGANAMAIAILLIENNVPLRASDMDVACYSKSLDVVHFVHDHSDAGCSSKAIDNAAFAKAWDIVAFLLAHYTAGCSLEAVHAALEHGQLELVTQLWARQPDLRQDCLLSTVLIRNQPLASLRFLLDAGVGHPRRELQANLGFQSHRVLGVMLPYCMQPNVHIDNLEYLVDLYMANALCLTKSSLLLVKTEMIAQATAAKCVPLPKIAGDELVARAAALFERGAVTTRTTPTGRLLDKAAIADWSSTVFVIYHWSQDATKHAVRLTQWTQRIQETEVKTLLERLLGTSSPTVCTCRYRRS